MKSFKIAFCLIVSMAVFLVVSCTTANGLSSQEFSNNNPNYVEIKGFAFNPSTVTVAVNTTIYWTNKDAATHTVTSSSGQSINSGDITTGNGFSFTFTTAGTTSYYCFYHTYMTGSVVVTN